MLIANMIAANENLEVSETSDSACIITPGAALDERAINEINIPIAA